MSDLGEINDMENCTVTLSMINSTSTTLGSNLSTHRKNTVTELWYSLLTASRMVPEVAK
jgi:hypothetical protein